jgi:N-acetyl-gamma-glutamyl-phosphate reductase
MEIVPALWEKGKKIIDLSADFRFSDVDSYEAFYQAHTAKDLLDEAVYGLCEVYKEDIAGANLIGNPGCYPTSVLLPLIPLLRKIF